MTTSDIFSLESIRSTLIRQEETIIFALIERAQFRRNHAVYEIGDEFGGNALMNDDGELVSLLDWMFMETEKLHAKIRRYTSPEEHPFFPKYISAPVLPQLEYPSLIVESKDIVDVNPEIMRWHITKILKRLCQEGDDEQYGSSALCDINAMQALSRRIHYGKFVAESKFLNDQAGYTTLLEKGDTMAVLDLLTNVEVERKVLRRAYLKAKNYGQDISIDESKKREIKRNDIGEGKDDMDYKVDPKLIADIYRDMIIPLTKDVEIRYLYNRVGLEPPPPELYLEKCRAPLDAFDDFADFESIKK